MQVTGRATLRLGAELSGYAGHWSSPAGCWMTALVSRIAAGLARQNDDPGSALGISIQQEEVWGDGGALSPQYLLVTAELQAVPLPRGPSSTRPQGPPPTITTGSRQVHTENDEGGLITVRNCAMPA